MNKKQPSVQGDLVKFYGVMLFSSVPLNSTGYETDVETLDIPQAKVSGPSSGNTNK